MFMRAFRVPKDGDEAATMMTKITSSPAFKLGSAGVVVMYLTFVASKRSGFGQKWSIRKKLQKTLMANKPKAAPIPMPEAERVLLGYLRNKPLGPIIISGPESCGTSQLVQRTVAKMQPWGLHRIDCDKYASADTDEAGVLNAFVRSSGYNMMPKIFGDLKLGRDGGGAISDGELQLCMGYYNEVIADTSKRALNLPVVFIDQAREHTPAFDQLLRSACHATDQGIAHVVIAAQASLTRKLDLTRSGFSERRRLILLDHPGKNAVKKFLVEKQGFKEESAEVVAHEIGGNFTDLQNLIGLKDDEDMMTEIIGELKADSLRILELHLDERLKIAADLPPNTDASVKIEAWKKVDRFWSLIDALAEHGRIERRTLSSDIFFQHSSEIDDMLHSGLLALVPHPPAQYTDHYRENEHWITAASPRLLRAMEHALKCPRLQKLRSHAKCELQKVEASQRLKELGLRKAMNTADLDALAITYSKASDPKTVAHYKYVLAESEALLSELKSEQERYDELRWSRGHMPKGSS